MLKISYREIKAEECGMKFEYYEFQNREGLILHLTFYITRPNRKRKFKNPLKYLLFRPTEIAMRIDKEIKNISGAIEIRLDDEEKRWIVKYLSSLEYPEVKIFLDEFEDRAE